MKACQDGSRSIISDQILFLLHNSEGSPENNVALVVCGDFNGGEECGAVRYLEDGFIDEKFREDGEPVSSGRKNMPLSKPLKDVST